MLHFRSDFLVYLLWCTKFVEAFSTTGICGIGLRGRLLFLVVLTLILAAFFWRIALILYLGSILILLVAILIISSLNIANSLANIIFLSLLLALSRLWFFLGHLIGRLRYRLKLNFGLFIVGWVLVLVHHCRGLFS